VVLPLSILVGVIFNAIRISRAMQKRLDLPDDIKARLAALTHQCAEADESITRHISKDGARWKKEEQRQARATAATLPAPGEATYEPEELVPSVPAQVWKDAAEPQRQAWLAQGMGPAEAA